MAIAQRARGTKSLRGDFGKTYDHHPKRRRKPLKAVQQGSYMAYVLRGQCR